MTPKEKAHEIVLKINHKKVWMLVHDDEYDGNPSLFYETLTHESSKELALMMVDEIMHVIDWHEFETPNQELNYWNRVKLEIRNL